MVARKTTAAFAHQIGRARLERPTGFVPQSSQGARREQVERVCLTYGALIRRVLRRSGVDAASMDDAVQDVLVGVVEWLPMQSRSQTSWLIGLCRNVASRYRRQRLRLSAQMPADECEAAVRTPEEYCELRQAHALLEDFLRQLDPKKRTLFELAELNGMPGAAAASALGINADTAYSRLRVARASFDRHVQVLQRQTARLAS